MRLVLTIRAWVLAAGIVVTALAQQPAPKPKAKPQPAPQAQPAASPADPDQPKRLILKDGSYQQTDRWEIRGERVRYYSAERSEWEELPKSLVDWDATAKYEKDRRDGTLPQSVIEADAEEEAELKAEEARSPGVAPGLHLPSQGGVFVLDIFDGKPELAELAQNGGDINANRAGNILRATINPLSKNKQTVELKGNHSQVQVHTVQPVVYIDLDQDLSPQTDGKAAPASGRYRIVRLTPKKDARTVSVVEASLTGKVKHTEQFVPTKSEVVSGPWVKLEPSQPLTPGEYAVVEMLGEDINLYVWDFGINPGAPANADAWKAQPVDQAKPADKDAPVLQKRIKQ